MINDPTKLILSTRYNFQKIYLNDSVVISVANVVPFTEYSLVVHGLGYIPTVRVFYEPVAGQLWPLSPGQYSNLNGGTGTPLNITGGVVVDNNEVRVRLSNASSTADVRFYYRIYIDE